MNTAKDALQYVEVKKELINKSMQRNVNNRKRTIERQNEKSAAKIRKIAAKITPEKGFGLSEIEIEQAWLMANDFIL